MSLTREEELQQVKDFRLIDDTFLAQVFECNDDATELILNIILERNDMKVKSMNIQQEFKAVVGHSVKFDIFAVDQHGKCYDIEIQRSDRDAVPQRARYNSAMLDSNILPKGQNYQKLTDSYIIFITENDVLKGGQPLYHIERKIEELNNDSFNDGSHIIFVNSSYRGSDSIGKLMHDFYCTDAKDMNFKALSDKVKFLKETEEGQNKVCRAMEKLIDAKLIDVAKKSLLKGNSIEDTADITDLPIEVVKELACELKENK